MVRNEKIKGNKIVIIVFIFSIYNARQAISAAAAAAARQPADLEGSK
jgi:hypothetical protein